MYSDYRERRGFMPVTSPIVVLGPTYNSLALSGADRYVHGWPQTTGDLTAHVLLGNVSGDAFQISPHQGRLSSPPSTSPSALLSSRDLPFERPTA